MLSLETKVVTYIDKKGEKSTYPLNCAIESENQEMVKRLKYTKNCLDFMLKAKPGEKVEGAANLLDDNFLTIKPNVESPAPKV